MKKRILSGLLALVMLVSVLPMSVLAFKSYYPTPSESADHAAAYSVDSVDGSPVYAYNESSDDMVWETGEDAYCGGRMVLTSSNANSKDVLEFNTETVNSVKALVDDDIEVRDDVVYKHGVRIGTVTKDYGELAVDFDDVTVSTLPTDGTTAYNKDETVHVGSDYYAKISGSAAVLFVPSFKVTVSENANFNSIQLLLYDSTKTLIHEFDLDHTGGTTVAQTIDMTSYQRSGDLYIRIYANVTNLSTNSNVIKIPSVAVSWSNYSGVNAETVRMIARKALFATLDTTARETFINLNAYTASGASSRTGTSGVYDTVINIGNATDDCFLIGDKNTVTVEPGTVVDLSSFQLSVKQLGTGKVTALDQVADGGYWYWATSSTAGMALDPTLLEAVSEKTAQNAFSLNTGKKIATGADVGKSFYGLSDGFVGTIYLKYISPLKNKSGANLDFDVAVKVAIAPSELLAGVNELSIVAGEKYDLSTIPVYARDSETGALTEIDQISDGGNWYYGTSADAVNTRITADASKHYVLTSALYNPVNKENKTVYVKYVAAKVLAANGYNLSTEAVAITISNGDKMIYADPDNLYVNYGDVVNLTEDVSLFSLDRATGIYSEEIDQLVDCGQWEWKIGTSPFGQWHECNRAHQYKCQTVDTTELENQSGVILARYTAGKLKNDEGTAVIGKIVQIHVGGGSNDLVASESSVNLYPGDVYSLKDIQISLKDQETGAETKLDQYTDKGTWMFMSGPDNWTKITDFDTDNNYYKVLNTANPQYNLTDGTGSIVLKYVSGKYKAASGEYLETRVVIFHVKNDDVELVSSVDALTVKPGDVYALKNIQISLKDTKTGETTALDQYTDKGVWAYMDGGFDNVKSLKKWAYITDKDTDLYTILDTSKKSQYGLDANGCGEITLRYWSGNHKTEDGKDLFTKDIVVTVTNDYVELVSDIDSLTLVPGDVYSLKDIQISLKDYATGETTAIDQYTDHGTWEVKKAGAKPEVKAEEWKEITDKDASLYAILDTANNKDLGLKDGVGTFTLQYTSGKHTTKDGNKLYTKEITVVVTYDKVELVSSVDELTLIPGDVYALRNIQISLKDYKNGETTALDQYSDHGKWEYKKTPAKPDVKPGEDWKEIKDLDTDLYALLNTANKDYGVADGGTVTLRYTSGSHKTADGKDLTTKEITVNVVYDDIALIGSTNELTLAAGETFRMDQIQLSTRDMKTGDIVEIDQYSDGVWVIPTLANKGLVTVKPGEEVLGALALTTNKDKLSSLTTMEKAVDNFNKYCTLINAFVTSDGYAQLDTAKLAALTMANVNFGPEPKAPAYETTDNVVGLKNGLGTFTMYYISNQVDKNGDNLVYYVTVTIDSADQILYANPDNIYTVAGDYFNLTEEIDLYTMDRDSGEYADAPIDQIADKGFWQMKVGTDNWVDVNPNNNDEYLCQTADISHVGTIALRYVSGKLKDDNNEALVSKIVQLHVDNADTILYADPDNLYTVAGDNFNLTENVALYVLDRDSGEYAEEPIDQLTDKGTWMYLVNGKWVKCNPTTDFLCQTMDTNFAATGMINGVGTIYLKYVSGKLVDDNNDALESKVVQLHVSRADDILLCNPNSAFVTPGKTFDLSKVEFTGLNRDTDTEFSIMSQISDKGHWEYQTVEYFGFFKHTVWKDVPKTDYVADYYAMFDSKNKCYQLDQNGLGTVRLRYVSGKNLDGEGNALTSNTLTITVGLDDITITRVQEFPTVTHGDDYAVSFWFGEEKEDYIDLSKYFIVNNQGKRLVAGQEFRWEVTATDGTETILAYIHDDTKVTFPRDCDPYRKDLDQDSSYTFTVKAVANGTDRVIADYTFDVTVLASRVPQEMTVSEESVAAQLFQDGKEFYIFDDYTNLADPSKTFTTKENYVNKIDLDELTVTFVDQYDKLFTFKNFTGWRHHSIFNYNGTTKFTAKWEYEDDFRTRDLGFDWTSGDGKLTWFVSYNDGSFKEVTMGDGHVFTFDKVGTYKFYATLGANYERAPYYGKFVQSNTFTVEVKDARTYLADDSVVNIEYIKEYLRLIWDIDGVATPGENYNYLSDYAYLSGPDTVIKLTVYDQYGDVTKATYHTDDYSKIDIDFQNTKNSDLTNVGVKWSLDKTGLNAIAELQTLKAYQNVEKILGKIVGQDYLHVTLGGTTKNKDSNDLFYSVAGKDQQVEMYFNGTDKHIRQGVLFDLNANLLDALMVRDQEGKSMTLAEYKALNGSLDYTLTWTAKAGKATTLDSTKWTLTDGHLLKTDAGVVADKESKQIVLTATAVFEDGRTLTADNIWLYVRYAPYVAGVRVNAPDDFVKTLPVGDNTNMLPLTADILDQYGDVLGSVWYEKDGTMKTKCYELDTATGKFDTDKDLKFEWVNNEYLHVDEDDNHMFTTLMAFGETADGEKGYLSAKVNGKTFVTTGYGMIITSAIRIVDIDIPNIWVWAKPGETLDLNTLRVVCTDQHGKTYEGEELQKLLDTYQAKIRWGISNPDDTGASIDLNTNILTFGSKCGKVVIAAMVVNAISFEEVNKNLKPWWPIYIDPVVPEEVEQTVLIGVDHCGEGSIAPAEGQITAPLGGNYSFTFTPAEGYVVDKVYVDNLEMVLNDKSGYTFVDLRAGHKLHVCFVKAEDVEPEPIDEPEEETIKNPFVDVAEGDYFYNAVLWALKLGVTDGIDATHFAPYASCTRAQFVTFLWRAAGMPEPKKTTTNFKDVSADAYYAKAVAWAVEKGITDGTSDTTFTPNAIVTRGQVVTFLYRYAGKPATSGKVSFKDVVKGAYYYDAVVWALSKNITDGTSDTTFSPNANCTRGQTVTFMYRAIAK